MGLDLRDGWRGAEGKGEGREREERESEEYQCVVSEMNSKASNTERP